MTRRRDPGPSPSSASPPFLRAAAVDARVEEFGEGTPTARDAARGRRLRARPDRQVARVRLRRRVRARARARRPARPMRQRSRRAVGAAEVRVARPDEVVRATGFEPGAVAPFPSRAVTQTPHGSRPARPRAPLGRSRQPAHMAALPPADLQRLARAPRLRPRGPRVDSEADHGSRKERERCKRPRRSG